jgi:hypothetical protein
MQIEAALLLGSAGDADGEALRRVTPRSGRHSIHFFWIWGRTELIRYPNMAFYIC